MGKWTACTGTNYAMAHPDGLRLYLSLWKSGKGLEEERAKILDMLNAAPPLDSALLAALEAWEKSAARGASGLFCPPDGRGNLTAAATRLLDEYRRWKAEHGARSEAERRVVEAAKEARAKHNLHPDRYREKAAGAWTRIEEVDACLYEAVDALRALDNPKPRYEARTYPSVCKLSGKWWGVYDGPAEMLASFDGPNAEQYAREHAARLNAAAEGQP